MAAITAVTPATASGGLVETLAITNQTDDTVTVKKRVAVPKWATYATVVIEDLLMAGTSPLFDFKLYGCNTVVPDDGSIYELGGWDGITQKTAAASTTTTIDIGPNVPADDTGSATASDRYGVNAVLPNVLVYEYTTDGTTDDEDYSGTISVWFRN